MQFLKTIKNNKVLFKNFSYLSTLQVINILYPLITYPYLIRVLGKELYGLIVFAQAIVGYLVILVSFGFNMSANRQVSINHKNKNKLSEIVSSVLIIKFFLSVISLLIFLCILFLIPQAKGHYYIFILTLWMCIYDVIFPTWYFLGIERMRSITIISFISRTAFLILVFVFIRSSSDYLLLPIFSGIGALLSGIIALHQIFLLDKVKFYLPNFSVLKVYFFDAIPIFISNVSMKIYVSTNKVLVGSFIGLGEVAFYDLGEKITQLLKMPHEILSQTIFPRVNKEKNRNFLKKILVLTIAFTSILSILTVLFSKQFIILFAGKNMYPAIDIVNILVISIPFIAVSNIFGIQILVVNGFYKTFTKVTIITGLIYIFLFTLIWLFKIINLINLTIITVLTEFFICMISIYFCKKLKLW